MSDHEGFMREAIELAQEKMLEGHGGPFGAIIVRDSEIIGRGWNQVTSANDPTAHAEVMAIRDACSRIQEFSLASGTIYCSCEPCPMCLGAIYWSRLDSIYFAGSSADAAEAGFDDRHIYEELNLPQQSRSLPMQQLLQTDALDVFSQWKRKEDRIDY